MNVVPVAVPPPTPEVVVPLSTSGGEAGKPDGLKAVLAAVQAEKNILRKASVRSINVDSLQTSQPLTPRVEREDAFNLWKARETAEEEERYRRDPVYVAEKTPMVSVAWEGAVSARIASLVDQASARKYDANKFNAFVERLIATQAEVALKALLDIKDDLVSLQYMQDEASLTYIEQLLVAAIGSPYEDVKDLSVTLLNSLYDGTDWQLQEPLNVTVRCVGDLFLVDSPVYKSSVDDMDRVFLLLQAPSFNTRSVKTILTRHRVPKAHSTLKVAFANFPRAGYYDWRFVIMEDDGSYTPLSVAGCSPSQVQGRFIVQPRVRSEQFHEVVVDLQDSAWDGDTGVLARRGTFETVRSALAGYKIDGITAIYLMGALERDNGSLTDAGVFPRPDASPLAIRCEGTPNTMLGSSAAFTSLMQEAERLGMKILIDSTPRVCASRIKRKYLDLVAHTIDEGGRYVPHMGIDGRDIQHPDSILLNYRKLAAWEMLVADIRHMVQRYGVHGARLENSQSWPLIMDHNLAELYRQEPDFEGEEPSPMYASLEILEGHVVIPGRETGYWSSKAAEAGYANPLLVKLTRAIWAIAPDFIFIGESKWGGRDKNLILSGLVPQSSELAKQLATLFGKQLLPDGSSQKIPKKPSLSLGEWWCKSRGCLPTGSLIISQICTHSSPYPALLYGRGSWSAVDALFLLSDLPMTFIGEEEGRLFRVDIPGVYRHPREEVREYINAHRNQNNNLTAHLQQKYKNIGTSVGMNASLGSSKGFGGRSSSMGDLASLAQQMSKRNNTFVDLKSLSLHASQPTTNSHFEKKEVSQQFGYELDMIKMHYDHRRELRQLWPILQRGHTLWLKPYHRFGPHEQVVSFARYLAPQEKASMIQGVPNDEPEVALIAINFNDADSTFSIDMAPIAPYIPADHANGPGSVAYAYKWDDLMNPDDTMVIDGFGGNENEEEEWKNVFARDEVVYGSNFTTVQPFSMFLWRLVRSPRTPHVEDRLLRNSFRRLRASLDANQLDSHNLIYCMLLDSMKNLSTFASTMETFASKLSRVYSLGIPGARRRPDQKRELISLPDTLQRSLQTAVRLGTIEGLEARVLAYLMAMVKLDLEDEDDEDDGIPTKYSLCREIYTRNRVGSLVFIAPELGKWSTVGGLGVMVDELTVSLAEMGADVVVISPYYDKNRKGETGYLARDGIRWSKNINVMVGDECVPVGVHEGRVKGVHVLFLHNHTFFPSPYNSGGADYMTKTLTVVAKASLETLCAFKMIPGFVVTNDWFGGMVAAYAKHGFFGNVFDKTTFFHIVHNLDPSYEGRIYPNATQRGLESIHRLPIHLLVDPFWTQTVLNPSRCALMCSDTWGTVSVSYKAELLVASPLKDLLSKSPNAFAYPNGIPVTHRVEALRVKAGPSHEHAKGVLQTKYFKFQTPDLTIPLFAFVGRITEQKGVHLILKSVTELINTFKGKIQIMIGGMANFSDPYSANCAKDMLDLRRQHPYNIWCDPAEFFVDGPTVNLGADFGLMPSLFEPGGIVQQEFFVAGTPVIAFRTGGLKDTVHEFDPIAVKGNGFVFNSHTPNELISAVKRAMNVYNQPDLYKRLRQNARESVIDCEEVAWAWYREFSRIKSVMIAKLADIKKEVDRVQAEMPALKPQPRIKGPLKPPPFVFRWLQPGNEVLVAGSFDEWKGRHALQRTKGLYGGGNEWSLSLAIEPGTYMCKFIIDGKWVTSPDMPVSEDSQGIPNNIVTVTLPVRTKKKKDAFNWPF